MSHIKRLRAPKSWEILRKEKKWVTKPRSGTHQLSQSLPLNTILKEFLNLTKITKETKHILNAGKVKVNGKIRKDHKWGVGLMDVVSVDDLNLHQRVLFNKKGKLALFPIKKTEANILPEKIIGKRSLKKNKAQINLSDGRNLLDAKKDYKVNDTVILDTATGKVKEHIKLEKGALIYITKGNKVGQVGVIKEIEEKKDLQPTKITFTSGKEQFVTLKEYALVIGKTKPAISIPE